MKKVAFSVPNFMYEILNGDMEYFKLKKGELGNRILNYFLGSQKLLKMEFRNGDSKRIQYNLTKNNEIVLSQIIREIRIEKESEYLRNIYFTYINNLKYIREKILFKKIFEDMEKAINGNKKILITYHSISRIVDPYSICVANKEERSYLFCYCRLRSDYRIFRISDIENIKILDSDLERIDNFYIEKIKENFDPFLSFGKEIVVKFTQKGKKRYEKALLNRPRLLSANNEIYTFQCSEKHAKVYFAQFYSEVEILKPELLREEFKKEYEEILKLYCKKEEK